MLGLLHRLDFPRRWYDLCAAARVGGPARELPAAEQPAVLAATGRAFRHNRRERFYATREAGVPGELGVNLVLRHGVAEGFGLYGEVAAAVLASGLLAGSAPDAEPGDTPDNSRTFSLPGPPDIRSGPRPHDSCPGAIGTASTLVERVASPVRKKSLTRGPRCERCWP